MKKRNQEKKAPRFASWLLLKVVRKGFHEEFLGDLEEIHNERTISKGSFYAKLMYWIDVLHLLAGFGSLPRLKYQTHPFIMYKHYITVASRNLIRNKVYSVINILSLAIGMGVFLLIYQYNGFELSFDKFHEKADNIYRVTRLDVGVEKKATVLDGYLLGAKAKEEIPEIRKLARLSPSYDFEVVVSNTDKNISFNEVAYLFVDPEFLEIFDFPLKIGNRDLALNDINSVVISEKTAIKYFGSNNPLGKSLNIIGGVFDGNHTVTGVLEDLPVNSHLQFDFLFPLEKTLNGFLRNGNNGWDLRRFSTYVYVDKSADLPTLAEKFNKLLKEHAGKEVEPQVGFQLLADIHLGAKYEGDPATGNGDMQNIKLFSIIAVFILIIAWVNYINLSTAHAIKRAKEVGIRKSIGASGIQLISQFMLDAVMVNILSAILAIAVAYLAWPIMGNIIGNVPQLDVVLNHSFWLGFAGIIILGSLLSGIYPAFVLSSFRPASMLKNSISSGSRSYTLRRGLIIFQFVISLLLVSGTYLVYEQINYMKNQDTGIDMEQILVVKAPNSLNPEEHFTAQEFFKNKVREHHDVSAVTVSTRVPGRGFTWLQKEIYKVGESSGTGLLADIVFVDADFLDTYDFEFLMRDSISKSSTANRRMAFINEEAVRAFGLESSENALNEKLVIFRDTVSVAGVLKNFHWQSLKDNHSPLILDLRPRTSGNFSIKINLSNIEESFAHVEHNYRSIFPDTPFNYFFLDEDFNRQYQSDVQFGKLFAVFALLAIMIACIGLYALISFSASLMVKEIGVRKVFGASIGNLMMLLSQEYLLLLLIANVVTIPLALYFGQKWLDNYPFRVGMGWDSIVVPGLTLVIISVLTVSHKTYYTAKANPIKSLRT